jgi:hypothetical protein
MGEKVTYLQMRNRAIKTYYRAYPEYRKWMPHKPHPRKKFRCTHCQKETPLLMGLVHELVYFLIRTPNDTEGGE